jgi:hypothetical protein
MDGEAEPEELSKRAKRKLEQLESKRIKEEKRSSYYETLEKYSMPDDQR